MTDNVLVHGLLTKRSLKLGWVNYSFLIGWPVITIFTVAFSQSPWCLLFVIPTPLGLPVKDYGNIFNWLLQHIQAEQIWRKDNGVAESPSVLRHGQKKKPKPIITWGDSSTVLAAFSAPNGRMLEMPLLLNGDGEYVTALIIDFGLSEETLADDIGEMYYDDVTRIRETVLALCKTRQPDLLYGQVFVKSLADQTRGYEYNYRRGNPDLIPAASATTPNGRYDEVDMTIAHHAMETHDNGYDGAGQGYNFSWIRMPYPRNRLGRKIDLSNPHKVRQSDIVRTIQELLRAYKVCGIKAQVVTADVLNGLLRTGLNLAELPTILTEMQRDRELVRKGIVKTASATPGGALDLWQPRTTSFGFDEETATGHMRIDGTYVAAGHVDTLTQDSQHGGFMNVLLQVPTGICFAFASIVDAPFVGYERVKAREKERWYKVLRGMLSMNDNLSTPDQDIQLNEIYELRKRLAESSNRAGIFTEILVVMSDTVTALKFDWDDVVTSLASLYTIKQVHLPGQLECWTKALFGIFRK